MPCPASVLGDHVLCLICGTEYSIISDSLIKIKIEDKTILLCPNWREFGAQQALFSLSESEAGEKGLSQ